MKGKFFIYLSHRRFRHLSEARLPPETEDLFLISNEMTQIVGEVLPEGLRIFDIKDPLKRIELVSFPEHITIISIPDPRKIHFEHIYIPPKLIITFNKIIYHPDYDRSMERIKGAVKSSCARFLLRMKPREDPFEIQSWLYVSSYWTQGVTWRTLYEPFYN